MKSTRIVIKTSIGEDHVFPASNWDWNWAKDVLAITAKDGKSEVVFPDTNIVWVRREFDDAD